ncbi:beta-lactamase-like protein [Exophiala viscosa]|uniref:Beta-lactamase-like protein n=1 Tax=Exophiala viscosa TaxID=2486360 RepID=A0AAN6DXF9_9EURO|nr:beta-lactamase-like protein [Exophiala viscosa]
MSTPKLVTTDNLIVCNTCGAQYDVDESAGKDECRICEDPRQFVPPEGQSFTTLAKLKDSGKYKNVFEQCKHNDTVTEIWTEPKFGIGQSARLIRTPHGNVLWDLIAYLDQDTVDKITQLGGIKFIIISHPHFYTTWADWSATFKCPVYMTEVDSVWANRKDSPHATLKLLKEPATELLPGLTAVICGGHFPGSMVLHSAPPNTPIPTLFVADAIFAVASGHNPDPGKREYTISYQFLWSIPNYIPLPPDIVLQIWKALKPFEFKATYGVFAKVSNVFERPGETLGLRGRVLQSAKIAVKAMGYSDHSIFAEEL